MHCVLSSWFPENSMWSFNLLILAEFLFHWNIISMPQILWHHLGPFHSFLPIRLDQSWAQRQWSLKINQASWTSLQSYMPWGFFSKKSLGRPMFALSVILPSALFLPSWSCSSPLHSRQAAAGLHTPRQFSLVCVGVQQCLPFVGSSAICVRKSSLVSSRNLLGFVLPACPGVVEALMMASAVGHKEVSCGALQQALFASFWSGGCSRHPPPC